VGLLKYRASGTLWETAHTAARVSHLCGGVYYIIQKMSIFANLNIRNHEENNE
jgi:hypothetical protein